MNRNIRKNTSKPPAIRSRIFPALFKLVLFIVVLSLVHLFAAGPSTAAIKESNKNQYVWSGVERIVAVGDLHGDYESFILILKGTGVVDDKLHWKAGKTHLVQIGDIMDRGDGARDIYDLIMRLEEEAGQAGGYVHMLLGNHEEANLTGIALDFEGYVTLGQFLSFLPEKFKEKKEKEFLRKRKIDSKDQMDPGLYKDFMKFWQDILDDARINSTSSARAAYTRNFIETYGKWIMDHNAVIKINKIIFVHGGISERYSEWSMEKINERLQKELKEFSRAAIGGTIPATQRLILYMPDGPLWHRVFAMNNDPGLDQELGRVLQNLGAEQMIIAHTPLIAGDDIISRFNQRVWVIDTGISEYYRNSGGLIRALIINDGDFSVWKPDSDIEDQVSEKQGGAL